MRVHKLNNVTTALKLLEQNRVSVLATILLNNPWISFILLGGGKIEPQQIRK